MVQLWASVPALSRLTVMATGVGRVMTMVQVMLPAVGRGSSMATRVAVPVLALVRVTVKPMGEPEVSMRALAVFGAQRCALSTVTEAAPLEPLPALEEL